MDKNVALASDLMPIIFLPHGGGPLPLMGDPSHSSLIKFLSSLAQLSPRPKAILMISAHWEASSIEVSSGVAPQLMFDYSGFPPETYQYTYPAPGAPALAERVAQALQQQSIAVSLNPRRGYDHGTFVPLLLAYPEADIPVVQVSLKADLNPASHIRLGRALKELRTEGVLIIGSGLSFHNMNAFFARDPGVLARSQAFDTWLCETLCAPELSLSERETRLKQWAQAPQARFCHPREEHLLPLLVCAGAGFAAGARAEVCYSDVLLGAQVSGFLWR